MNTHTPYTSLKLLLNRRRADIVVVMAVFCLGCVLGAHTYHTALAVHDNPLGTVLSELAPAVLFAAGHGMIRPEALDVPALDAFLAAETNVFDTDALPSVVSGSHIVADAESGFFLRHWLLMYGVGWCWRIVGVTHASLSFLCAFMVGLTALALYCLFRLGMGRILSVMGTLWVILLPPFLAVAPMLHHVGKTPFLLLSLALAGYLLKHRTAPEHLLRCGVAFGVVIGLGMGFRQEVAYSLPVAFLVMLTAPIQGGWRPLYRMAACALTFCAFLLLALPVLMGMRVDGEYDVAHSLFQGTSRNVEQHMGFGDGDYALLLHPDDAETRAMINAHARMRGFDTPMDVRLSNSHDRAGRQLFVQWARMFPADMVARVLAATGAVTRLSALSDADNAAHETMSTSKWLAQWQPVLGVYHRYVAPFGLLFVTGAFVYMALYRKWLAAATVLLVGWHVMLASMSFDMRHVVYLAFVTPWAVGFLVQHTGGGLLAGIRALSSGQRVLPVGCKQSVRQALLMLVMAVLSAAALLGLLRFIQADNVRRLEATYRNAPREEVPIEISYDGMMATVMPRETLPELRDSWNLPLGETASAYLVLAFEPAAHPTPVSLTYAPGRFPDFTRQILVPARAHKAETVLCYAPVYEMANFTSPTFATMKRRFAHAPLMNFLIHRWGVNRFVGIRMHRDDVSRLKAVYRVTDVSALPWLLHLRTTAHANMTNACKRTWLEKELYALPVALRRLITRDTDVTLSAWFDLLDRFSGHSPFGDRIARHGENMEDDMARAALLFRLGRHAPERAHAVACEIARIGDKLRGENSLEQALKLYRHATVLAPQRTEHITALGDVMQGRGDYDGALKHYQMAMRSAPESFETAERLEALCLRLDMEAPLTRFWRELHGAYPDAVEPALRLGRVLEEQDRTEDALAVYRRMAARHPDHPRLLLQQGVLTAVLDGYTRGRALMDRALEMAPDMAPEFVVGLARIAAHHMDTGAPTFAEAIYWEVMERAPDEHRYQARLGELLYEQDRHEEARELFVDVLRAEPEAAEAAAMLDAIQRAQDTPGQREAFWRALADAHPKAAAPRYYLGGALTDAGDTEAALDAYIDALRLNQEHTAAREALHRMLMQEE